MTVASHSARLATPSLRNIDFFLDFYFCFYFSLSTGPVPAFIAFLSDGWRFAMHAHANPILYVGDEAFFFVPLLMLLLPLFALMHAFNPCGDDDDDDDGGGAAQADE
jgi:hypothetical protein